MAGAAPSAIARLDELTRRLRRECPWDREQDERSIVAHTVSEAYELADAAHSGDDAKLLDELGDLLFQVHFLSLLLEERGAGDLAAVADHCAQKLIRRHPHVFGDVEVDGTADVRRNWDEIKRTREGRGAGGLFGDVPENLPALALAAKLQRRAAGEQAEPPFRAAEAGRAALCAGALRACARRGPRAGAASREHPLLRSDARGGRDRALRPGRVRPAEPIRARQASQ
jgi:NTP pyrophosphatase (non-canonical NTP hydrolase)